jgi:GT2 family glycosyltransferase
MSRDANDSSSFLTVLVLYKQRLEDSPAYRSLSRALYQQSGKRLLFVYDNSPQKQTLPSTDTWKIIYVHDASNPGVSRAYNQALVCAQQFQKDWLLLADQDTIFPITIYQCYKEALLRNPLCSVFLPTLVDVTGIISPFTLCLGSGKRLKKSVTGKKLLTELSAVNSGLFLSRRIIEQTGGYDEKLTLDFSDIHFFHTLKQHTDHLVIVDAVCQHEHSSAQKDDLFSALHRFTIYVHGARRMGHLEDAEGMYWLRACLRAMKLSWRYRSFHFLRSVFSYNV